MNSRCRSGWKRRGSAMVEFTFVGIPLMFTLISTFEISRGMWMYHTTAYAVKQGIRYAEVHGINCVKTTSTGGNNPNDCQVTIGQIAGVIQGASVGLDPAKATLSFNSTQGIYPASPCTITACLADATNWPPYDATGLTTPDGVGQRIRIDITIPFRSAIAMFWPGSAGVTFGVVNMAATSTDYIQF